MISIQNICIRDKNGNPVLFIDGLSGTTYPLAENACQIKLNKIINCISINFDKDDINLHKYNKELFLKGCEMIYDLGAFEIFGDLVIL